MRLSVAELRMALRAGIVEHADNIEEGPKDWLRNAALAGGIATGMGGNAHAADKPTPQPFKFANKQDPTANAKKYQFGNKLDPVQQGRSGALADQIKSLMGKYKGNPMQEFFMRGFKACSSDPDGKLGSLKKERHSFMEELSSKNMSSHVPLEAFNDGVALAKARIEQASLKQ